MMTDISTKLTLQLCNCLPSVNLSCFPKDTFLTVFWLVKRSVVSQNSIKSHRVDCALRLMLHMVWLTNVRHQWCPKTLSRKTAHWVLWHSHRLQSTHLFASNAGQHNITWLPTATDNIPPGKVHLIRQPISVKSESWPSRS